MALRSGSGKSLSMVFLVRKMRRVTSIFWGITVSSLGLIVDTVRESDLVQEVDGLTFVIDPDTHGLAGEVRVSLADDEERTAFILTSSNHVGCYRKTSRMRLHQARPCRKSFLSCVPVPRETSGFARNW